MFVLPKYPYYFRFIKQLAPTHLSICPTIRLEPFMFGKSDVEHVHDALQGLNDIEHVPLRLCRVHACGPLLEIVHVRHQRARVGNLNAIPLQLLGKVQT